MMAVAAFVVGLVAVTVTTRRCRPLLLFAILGVEQVLMHLLFGAAGSMHAAGTPGLCAASSTHGHHGAALLCSPQPVAVAGQDWTPASVGMMVAHIAALVATVWLLSRGEAWLWGTADLIVHAATVTISSTVSAPTAALVSLYTSPTFSGPGGTPAAPRGPPVGCSR